MVCSTRCSGLQLLARISALCQEKTRLSEVGETFPRNQKTVPKQKLLEESEVLHALCAYRKTPDCCRNQVMGDGIQRDPGLIPGGTFTFEVAPPNKQTRLTFSLTSFAMITLCAIRPERLFPGAEQGYLTDGTLLFPRFSS